jgi:hypothetical protein
MKLKERSNAASRRRFLGVIPAAALCAARPEGAPAQAVAPDPLSAQADVLCELVKLRFGSYLKEGDITDIKRVIERNLRYGDALSKVPIGNSDEPDFMFIPNAGL